MVKRKSVPRLQSPVDDTTTPILRTQQLADPNVKRYSLSDGPVTSSYVPVEGDVPENAFADINQSVDRLLQEHPQESHPNEQDAYHSQAESESGHSMTSSAAHTAYSRPLSSVEYTPYRPGQYLAPIMTGETLQLDELPIQPSPLSVTNDPFNDPYTPIASTPQQRQLPLQPTQAEPTYYYDQDYHPPSSHSHGSLYENDTLHAGSSTSELDHFRTDPEAAYSSARFGSASPYQIPRSRSPTPAVDDEDYYVVGNESLHYVGYNPNRSYDAEKAALHSQYGYSESQAYLSPGHGTGGGNVVYDPEPPTPSSTQLTLPETPLETRHFGPAPSGRILRRHKTKKRVQLTNGNLVVDLNVPPKLVLPRRGEPETMKTRYTAVTCDPDDFEKKGFFLRQNESGRRTEMFIVITMYNEDEVLFCRTLHGVMQNISHLCTRKNSQTWGPNAWEKVVVCIVADGRKKVHPRVLDCLTLLGVYQPGDHMKRKINDQDVTAHVFEYTTSFALDSNLHFRYPDKGIVPTQIIFCMKEKNQKKINSHRWFFNAFAPMLQPNVCILLDVGTRPGKNSIYRLWKAFDLNSTVGGACGEIAVYKGEKWKLLLNPLVAAQNFEYKISCILDKPTESMFGYISVLPGAFSAYRYIALLNDKHGVGPLASYFKGEVLHGRDTDIFTSNMYLAEDRILCFELVAKANSSWVLKYVKGAIGETDVPDALPEFISQRRRWLNGSFFAATYAIAHVGQIMRSGHSFARKVVLMIETIYNIINLIFSWFSIGNFYLFFVVLTSSLEDKSFGLPGIGIFNTMVQYVMASMIIAIFLFSMGNKPQAAEFKYKVVTITLGVLMIYMVAASIQCAIQAGKQGGSANSLMLLSILITFGLYALASFLAFDPWHVVTSFGQYMLLSPMYINVLNIYAFSNLDDISWGTKQDSTPETDLGVVVQNKDSQVDVEMLSEPADINGLYEESLANLRDRVPVDSGKPKERSLAEKELAAKDYYADVRTNVLLAWVLSNGLLLLFILGGGGSSDTFGQSASFNKTKTYLLFILAFTAITNSIRFLGCFLYLCGWLITG